MSDSVQVDAGVEPFLEGVWRLRGVAGANVYLVRLEGGAEFLVDAGLPGAATAIIERLDALDARPSALLLTHRHWDHAGGAAELQERLGLRVVAGTGDVEHGHLRGDRKPPRWLQSLLHRGNGVGAPAAVDEALPMDRQSEVLPGVFAVPAPGHTAGSLCFFIPAGELIFVGDVTLNSGDRLSRPIPFSNDDTTSQEASLAAIAALAPRHGAPGHGPPLPEVFGEWMRRLASMPPAPGPSLLRILRNPRAAARFARRMRGS
jgi:glyoxylase-like metal-dependent hydrolase (beta-lactamase superfamily II)